MAYKHTNGDPNNDFQPRLIPHVVSETALKTPDKIWASIPKSSHDATQGYKDITFAQLNSAITRAALWLKDNVEPQKSMEFEPLAYIGSPDTRYIIFSIAAVKVGFQMLFLSPRNSDEAQESVIQQAKCVKFFTSSSMDQRIKRLFQSRPKLSNMSHFTVPDQEELLQNDLLPDLPYERTVEAARFEPLVTLHTSSTTGIPKTIPLNQGYGMYEDVLLHIPKHNNLDLITRKPFYGHCKMFVAMPLFHAGGVLLTLLKSLYHDIISVFQPSDLTMNAQLFYEILVYGECTGCVIPPYLLEEMLTEPAHFDKLASLDFVQFGSGPLSKAVGDLLLTRQNNCPHYIGSSECGLYLLTELDDPVADWQYFRFHPWSGADMRPIDNSNKEICELYIVRLNAPKITGLQPVFELFPDQTEWPTRDLYVRHPTKPDHWRYVGRNDDIIVLSNGEKVNPVDTESRITNAHPSVTGALVVGQGRFAPGLLLEVRGLDFNNPAKRVRLIEEIWPTVQLANQHAPGHAQLTKSLMLFTSPEKPFLRTPKLSIRRKITIDAYATEIAELYDSYAKGDESTDGDVDGASQADIEALKLSSLGSIRAYISSAIHDMTGWGSGPNPGDDLFMYGMDSLQVSRITRTIKAMLLQQAPQAQFTSKMVYSNPTIDLLSKALHAIINKDGESTNAAQEEARLIEEMIADYSKFEFPSVPDDRSQILNVLLTGSTGSLGGWIALALLADAQVSTVYCLDRADDAKERHASFAATQGIDTAPGSDYERRVRFLCIKSLELMTENDSYATLQQSHITHVIHCAWPVNFNLTLHSFTSQLAGVRALIDFSASVQPHPKLIFVSSLSSMATLSWKQSVPEQIVVDPLAPAGMGYGQSKYVAEHLFSKATEASHGAIPSAILRVGQIAGPVKSNQTIWPAREWLPSIVISSKTVKVLPASLGRMNVIDWVPVDILADSIREILISNNTWVDAEGRNRQQAKVFHVLNPNKTTWQSLLPGISAQIGVDRVVSLNEWIEHIRQGPDEDSVLLPNPAKNIIPYYESLQNIPASADLGAHQKDSQTGYERYELGNMSRSSESFSRLQGVSGEWMANWTAKWV